MKEYPRIVFTHPLSKMAYNQENSKNYPKNGQIFFLAKNEIRAKNEFHSVKEHPRIAFNYPLSEMAHKPGKPRKMAPKKRKFFGTENEIGWPLFSYEAAH